MILNRPDKENLEIAQFVFHVLENDREEPRYLDEVRLNSLQRKFFNDWLIESLTKVIEYEFRDKNSEGTVFHVCQKFGDDEIDFSETTQSLAKQFKRHDTGSSKNSLLVFSLVHLDSGGSILFLVKMPHSDTLQFDIQTIDGREVAVLSSVQNPINESKQAIQKAAIINIDSQYDWDVFARDKYKGSEPEIAIYFKEFLDVREKEVSSELTRRVFAEAHKWAKKHKSELDPDQHPTDYKGRALD